MPAENLGNLSKTLLEIFQSANYQPPRLPEVAQEIMRLTQDSHASISEFVSLLERDQLLTGRVLQIANSPFYSPTQHADVTSLHRAVVRLGLRALSNIAVETWLALRVFRAQRYSEAMRRLSHHSVVTAYAAQIVSKHACVDSDYFFLCGLMHDVGVAGALTALEDASGNEEPPALEDAAAEIDMVHGRLSEVMVRLWQLPDPIPATVRFHHSAITPAGPDRNAAVIGLAEDLANRLGWTFAEPGLSEHVGRQLDMSDDARIRDAIETLGLDAEDATVMLTELEETVERLTWIH